MRSALLITGATVLDPEDAIREADIRIVGDTISEVGPGLRPDGEEVIDARGMLVTPGMVNAHTHSGQSLDQGLCPLLPLDLWMMWIVYAGEEPSAESLYTTAAAGALAMLRTGSTTVLDHVYLAPEDFERQSEAVISAYSDVGLRAAVAPMVQDLDYLESLPVRLIPDEHVPGAISARYDPQSLLETMSRFLDRWTDRIPTVMPMLGPDAPQRCSDEFLAGMAALARERDAGVHCHLLEVRSQVFACRERFGTSLIDALSAFGLLGPRTSFAHGVWLQPEEYRAIAEAGAVLVHNPVSNLRLGSGVMPLAEILEIGGRVALGTDGAASNDDQNMFEVLKLASILPTVRSGFRGWPGPDRIWSASLAGGAAAVGLRLGRVAPGFKADLMLLDLERHVRSPKEFVVRSLVLGELGDSINAVICGGEIVMREGRSTKLVEAPLRAAAAALRRGQEATYSERDSAYRQWEPFMAALVGAADREPLPFDRRLP